MKTIRRNSKKLNSVWENGKDGKVYNQRNYFKGETIAIATIQKVYEKFSFAILWGNGNGNYSVSLDSTEWFEFNSI